MHLPGTAEASYLVINQSSSFRKSSSSAPILSAGVVPLPAVSRAFSSSALSLVPLAEAAARFLSFLPFFLDVYYDWASLSVCSP